MSAFSAMAEIESFSGKGSKKDKLNRLKKLTADERDIFCLAYDPDKVFYYQVDLDEIQSTVGVSKVGVSDDHAQEALVSLCESLSTRTYTGHAARDAVNGFMSTLTMEQQKWAARIINKDLCIGVSEKTYLKAFPGSFKLFECMLAEPADGDTGSNIGWEIEPKFNGLRAIGIPLPDGTYNCFSRNGKLLFGLDHICADMGRVAKAAGVQYVFDGEACGEKWKDYAKARTKSATVSDLNYFCFDLLTLQEWEAKKAPIYVVRKARRFEVLNKIVTGIIAVDSVQATPAYTPKMAMDENLKIGLEGIVLKDPGAPYVWKRHQSWTKMKPRDNVDLTIVGAMEGDKGKQYEGQLGAIVVDYNGVHTEIGTGFSNVEREEFWKMHKRGELVGKTAEIEMGDIENCVTEDGKLFHASFIRLRFDK